MDKKEMKAELKRYFYCVLICFAIIVLVLATITLIVCIPPLAEGFNKFFGASAMSWEEAKTILIVDYVIAIPISFLFGLFLWAAIEV